MPQYLTNPSEQRFAKRHLDEAQKSSPEVEIENQPAKKPSKFGKIGRALNLVQPSNDAIFAIIISGGILKDVADMLALALVAQNDSSSGAGYILPPILSIMYQLFATFAVLRKFAVMKSKIANWKVLVGINIFQFIFGSFVGLSGWFPEATLSGFLLYYFTLKGRKKSARQGDGSSQAEDSSEESLQYA